MRLKHQLRLLITILAVSSIALPGAAMAHKKCCSYMGKGGVIYNETDGMYYRVPSTKCGYVYRAVDLKYVKVAKKGMVGVTCQMQPGFWWGSTWYAPHNECWYVR